MKLEYRSIGGCLTSFTFLFKILSIKSIRDDHTHVIVRAINEKQNNASLVSELIVSCTYRTRLQNDFTKVTTSLAKCSGTKATRYQLKREADKISGILQTTFPNWLSCMKIVVFSLPVKLVPNGLNDNKPALVQSLFETILAYFTGAYVRHSASMGGGQLFWPCVLSARRMVCSTY